MLSYLYYKVYFYVQTLALSIILDSPDNNWRIDLRNELQLSGILLYVFLLKRPTAVA